MARNQLKLPDLGGPVEFLRGDPLLRANRRLACDLDGVYHRGEVYLRWLQRLSSLAFGTRVGRFLTDYFLIPFGGAFFALKGVDALSEESHKFFGSPEVRTIHAYSLAALGVRSAEGLAALSVRSAQGPAAHNCSQACMSWRRTNWRIPPWWK